MLIFLFINNKHMKSQDQPAQEKESNMIEKKKRKTLDQYVGINGLCIIGIIGGIFGGILKPIGAVAGISAIYYLIKKRKELSSSQRWTGWLLMLVWLAIYGITSNPK